MKMKRIVVVIATYNGAEIIEECVFHALNQEGLPGLRIIIVDDASTDETIQKINKRWTEEIKSGRIEIISNKINLGVAGAYNVGIKKVLDYADYILKIDNDLILKENSVIKMVELLEGNPKAKIAGGKLLFYDKPNRIQSIGGKVVYLLGIVPIIKILGKNASSNKFNNPLALDVIGGCMMLFRKETFLKNGFFDEIFGKYSLEDFDYQLRVRKNGGEILYCPDAKGFHKVSYTSNKSKKLSDYRITYSARNSLLLFFRQLPSWKFEIYIIFYFFKIILEAIIKRRNILCLFNGYLDGLKLCKKLAKEKKI